MKYKKIIVFAILLCMLFAFNSSAYAIDISGMFQTGKDFINNGNAQVDDDALADLVTPITGLIIGIGTAIIVGLGIVCGINYITGGPDKQAESKKQLIGLVVSAIVLWGCYGIWATVYNILNKVVQ